jgi:hypothetical protein
MTAALDDVTSRPGAAWTFGEPRRSTDVFTRPASADDTTRYRRRPFRAVTGRPGGPGRPHPASRLRDAAALYELSFTITKRMMSTTGQTVNTPIAR